MACLEAVVCLRIISIKCIRRISLASHTARTITRISHRYEFLGQSAAQLSLDERSVMLIAEHFEDAEQSKKIEDLSACFNVNEDTLDDPKTIPNIRDLGCARNLLYKASMSLGNWYVWLDSQKIV